jgi:hypothetical protein
MNRCEPLEFYYRDAPTLLGLRACPFEPSGGRDPDAAGLTQRQRSAATKSSRVRTALATLDGRDQFLLENCYRPTTGATWDLVDPANNWVTMSCGSLRVRVDDADRVARGERALAREATRVAGKTRDRDGINSALARAASHLAAEKRALAKKTDAEIVHRRAALAAAHEAEAAQGRFEAAYREVMCAQAELDRFVHGKRVEVLQLGVAAAAKPKRRTIRQIVLDKVAAWVVAMMGVEAP